MEVTFYPFIQPFPTVISLQSLVILVTLEAKLVKLNERRIKSNFPVTKLFFVSFTINFELFSFM